MTILFSFPGNHALAELLREGRSIERGSLSVHSFPDGETLIRIDSDIKGKDVIALCSLDRPNEKAIDLMFFAETARELGASSIKLIAPYLGYMRQDKRFHKGEAITSNVFAAFVSKYFDSIVTIDPHLHRHKDMGEIYSIPATVVHAAGAVAAWIKENVESPVLIGPDEESEQWVSDIAEIAGVPYTVLQKIRRGDRDVEISIPKIGEYKDRTPVLIDDIISTAQTMIVTIRHLNKAGMKPPVCVGVHAVFAGNAYENLKAAGAGRIVTCNTIVHATNGIDISGLLVQNP